MSETTTLWDRINEVGLVYWREITLGVLDIVGVGIGILWWRTNQIVPTKIEIITKEAGAATAVNLDVVAVDISGEVVNPGVYKLPGNLLIDDLLASAGGLTANSDTDWIAKNINKAEKIRNGMKIFIPALGSSALSGEANAVNIISASAKININQASQSDLEDLPGVGLVTAQKIIAGRPFITIEGLKEKKIVSSRIFEEIKDRIVAW
jgi:DNA uptake protein ComE-like DNA-binding protein